MRIGIGYDVHKLTEGRKLILGRVEIPFKLGFEGHSDADILLHAIGDALLGACGKGDLGKYFPPTDVRWKDISSLILLKEVYKILQDEGYEVNNLDAVIVLEEPKIFSYTQEMKKNISEILEMKKEDINIKSTTSDGIGFVGKKEGAAAYAVVSIIKKEI